MYWPHIWWLIQAVKRGVDCMMRRLYAALIIHCVDCSVAESSIIIHYSIVGAGAASKFLSGAGLRA
jgi:hypothetical protein